MITVIIKYCGKKDNAKRFMEEMISSHIVEEIRNEKGNLRYEYFIPVNDKESVLLIDSWIDQSCLDEHHKSPLMNKIAQLREKYDLHMEVNKYQEIIDKKDDKFIRK